MDWRNQPRVNWLKMRSDPDRSIDVAMKKSSLSYILATAVLLVSGCHYILKDLLYNNSGQDLLLTTFRRETNSVVLKSGQIGELRGTVKLEVRRSDGGIWEYKRVSVPFEFHKLFGINRHLVEEQIQEDGAIFLLSPGTSAPVTNFPPQPPGYPIRPK